jgi:hypothetical protein
MLAQLNQALSQIAAEADLEIDRLWTGARHAECGDFQKSQPDDGEGREQASGERIASFS